MIIVFGSLNIDMVMSVKKFPKVGETIVSDKYETSPGGKGSNQAVASARFGAKTVMIGMVGDDGFGRRATYNLKKQMILGTGVGTSDRATGCASILVNDKGENQVIVAPGANLDVASNQIPDEILIAGNVLITQMEVNLSETWDVIKRAHQHNTITILNASPVTSIPPEVLDDLDYIIVNNHEVMQLADELKIKAEDERQAAIEIAKRGKLTCIVTLEEAGSIAATSTGIWSVKAMDVTPVDTTGAGDSFCGVFAAAIGKGLGISEALHLASIGAGISCLGYGAQGSVPYIEQIEDNLDKLEKPVFEKF